MANFAESNRVSLRYIAESTWGTTPGSGTTREMRITSSSIVASKETAISEEIRSDRMVSDIIETAASSSGDVNFEFSAGSVDDFFQAFLLGTWSLDMTMDRVEGASVDVATTSTVTITSSTDYSAMFPNGNYIKLEGFVNQENNDYHLLTGSSYSSGVTTLTVTGTPLVVESGTSNSKVMDANDVIVESTTIAFTAPDQIGVTGAFTTAVANGELVAGMKVFVDGLGYEVGSLEIGVTNPVDGETFTVNDGDNEVAFEFDDDSSVTTGYVSVTIGADSDGSADNLAAAIQNQAHSGALEVTADVDATNTDLVTITNLRSVTTGTDGGTLTDGTSGTLTQFAGGVATTNGIFTVASVDDDAITTEETVTTDANSGTIKIVVKGSHLRNPGTVSDITKQSFTVETGFTDVGQYFLMTGMRIGSFSMSVASGEIVNGTFSMSGSETSTSQTDTLGNSPYTALPTTATEVFNSTANVGSVKKDGSAIATAVQSIEINGDAGLREQRAVANKFPAGIGVGRFTLTGTLTTYFEDLTMYNHFIDHDTISLEWDFTDQDSNYYVFTIPALKILSDPVSPGRIDQDILEELEWTALRDSTLSTMFMIDRFSSVYPTEAKHTT